MTLAWSRNADESVDPLLENNLEQPRKALGEITGTLRISTDKEPKLINLKDKKYIKGMDMQAPEEYDRLLPEKMSEKFTLWYEFIMDGHYKHKDDTYYSSEAVSCYKSALEWLAKGILLNAVVSSNRSGLRSSRA